MGRWARVTMAGECTFGHSNVTIVFESSGESESDVLGVGGRPGESMVRTRTKAAQAQVRLSRLVDTKLINKETN